MVKHKLSIDLETRILTKVRVKKLQLQKQSKAVICNAVFTLPSPSFQKAKLHSL
jgi:hypothetical protein